MTGFSLGPTARAAGYRLRGYDSIGSTNSEALVAAAAGDAGGLWFAALQQTAGRGRRGRQWESPHGNLAATLLIVPDSDPTAAATLGFVAGVSLNRALSKILPNGLVKIGIDGADSLNGGRIALKWPNDVLADGAKLAGILLEASKLPDGRHAVAIGFGVNAVAAPEGLPYPATSLTALGVRRDAAAVFEALSDAWVETFGLWDDGRGIGDVLKHWRASAAGIGAPVAVNQNGEVLRGIFETIDDDGRLIVRSDDNRRIAITAGDVHFGATASARS
ncbi:BirA family transcriptional regulator, biotin operon repressor / biotin-[acetyl-CoA-carboxylase] ligase [Devosia sp. YR412]|uniref:biotin--[acetyl-CoA-carboxylase] ligase n=1 Tax=Devosia sp. YR412 TaxID=1881030 RepID=UPI0008B7AF80|nr:biotin--[acetyl-CoA-carboxylase] ligase [Devosia sp. YR412]SEQ50139.1 BirA family transcriptional regulator, biotin operon repressor / biotin-[acetyl-CoA-carboxylase] ligase [Devosia sp. YR412]